MDIINKMSIIVNIDNIPWEIRNKINSDLEIKIENKFAGGKPRIIYPFEIEENNEMLIKEAENWRS